MTDLDPRMTEDRADVEARCRELLDKLASQHGKIHEAMQYSLLGGGKRIRPLLCLWTHDLVAQDSVSRDAVLDACVALESVHTYSLIHDDLPAMDNDDLRRGKPSSHKEFGEATAILTGDALLSFAFEVLGTMSGRHEMIAAGDILLCVQILSRAAGTGGLITGQALDLDPSSGNDMSREDLVNRIHENKTARLIAASMLLGGCLGGACGEDLQSIAIAGTAAGRAFQIVDDLLDIESTRETLGKTPGKDAKDGKLTYPAVMGVDAARHQAVELIDRAQQALPGARDSAIFDLLGFITERTS